MFHQQKNTKNVAVGRNLADGNTHPDVTVCGKMLVILYRTSDGEVFEDMK